jgi:hypothetical protein
VAADEARARAVPGADEVQYGDEEQAEDQAGCGADERIGRDRLRVDRPLGRPPVEAVCVFDGAGVVSYDARPSKTPERIEMKPQMRRRGWPDGCRGA